MIEQINNRYRLKLEIGKGGMGTVYRAYDRLTDTQVALKRVHATSVSNKQVSSSQTDNEFELLLANEFRTLASLRHPNIISVLDYGFDTQSSPYYTMTLLEEKQDFLEATQDKSFEEQIPLFGQMFLALVYLHQRGIIHRDIKPANVLVSHQEVKLLDFGLSVSTESNHSRAGTIQYMAPETLARGITVIASDLYATGVIMYQAISGEMPYKSIDIQNRVERPVSMVHMKDHPLENVVARLLDINPEDRYQTAEEVIQAIYRAINRTAPEETGTIVESFLQTAPFVGREHEIEQLENALKQDSSLWLVGGESGVGKSRLVEELRIRALVSGRLVIQGQANQQQGVPYAMLRPVVRRLCLQVEPDDWTAGILKDLISDIDSLLNREIIPAPQLTGRAYQERLAGAIETLVSEQVTPMVLILEDLHWAEENLLIIEHLASVMDTLLGVMMIATYREDEAPQLQGQFPQAQHLHLRRLDEDAILKLSSAMMGDAGSQKQVIELMKRETGGNIFFMVEVARTLAEEAGAISNIGRKTLPQQVFTGSMQEMLQKRIQKLPERHHPILYFAAVYGRRVNLELLNQVFAPDAVQDWLYACETRSILITQDNQWLFIHDKIQDAILDNLSDEEKKGVHGEVARAIERTYPDDFAYHEVLLNHWHLADHIENETRYLNRVAVRLIRITGEYDKARTLLNRTLARLPEGDTGQITLLNYLAECYWESGKIKDAEAIAYQALSLTGNHDMLDEQASAHLMLGQTKRIRDEYDEALSHAKQALELYQGLDDRQGISLAYYVMGNAYARTGDYRLAGEYFEQSLQLARELDEFRIMSLCLEELGMVMRVRRNIDKAITYIEESLDISTKLGDKRGIALKLNSLGRAFRDRGRYEVAEEKLLESLRLLKQLKDSYGASWSAYNLGLLVQIRGEYDFARTMTENSLQTYELLNDKYGIAICVSSLGFINLAEENTEEAIAQFCGAIRIGRETSIPALALTGIVGLAIILHQRGEEKRAGELIHLANHHPATNTEVYFRLANLPDALTAHLSQAVEDDSLTSYDEALDSLLVEFG